MKILSPFNVPASSERTFTQSLLSQEDIHTDVFHEDFITLQCCYLIRKDVYTVASFRRGYHTIAYHEDFITLQSSPSSERMLTQSILLQEDIHSVVSHEDFITLQCSSRIWKEVYTIASSSKRITYGLIWVLFFFVNRCLQSYETVKPFMCFLLKSICSAFTSFLDKK